MSTARVAALHLLSRRDYTVAEIRDKLATRDYAPDAIELAIDSLSADGLLDDRRAAATHVRTASRIKGRGRHRIQHELEARGIARAIVRDALDDLPPADELTAITRFLRRHRLPAAPSPAERRRVFQQLLRRGFSADVITRALGTHTPED